MRTPATCTKAGLEVDRRADVVDRRRHPSEGDGEVPGPQAQAQEEAAQEGLTVNAQS